jgi:sugar/nucleoside kinase (ribokinase family)
LLQTQGGGNCANALTAAARLGLKPVLISKIGGDAIGDGIISELENDGVSTEFVLRAKGHPSPFTYIIVDREGMASLSCCNALIEYNMLGSRSFHRFP